MTTVAPLAQVLRQIRIGRVAIAEGRLHAAIMCRDCASHWMVESWGTLPTTTRRVLLQVRDLDGYDRARQHRFRRLLFVQRIYDAYGYALDQALTAARRAREIARNTPGNSTTTN